MTINGYIKTYILIYTYILNTYIHIVALNSAMQSDITINTASLQLLTTQVTAMNSENMAAAELSR